MRRDDGELVPLDVAGVRRHLPAEDLVVLLHDPVGRLVLPIVVGPAEATSIAVAVEGVVPLRPLTHDLLCSVIEATGNSLDHVEITQLVEGVFHAALVLGSGIRIDSRASDAIGLAVRTGSPVMCRAEVLAAAGVEATSGDDDDEELAVEKFREFLEGVEPEDFEGEEPSP
ncbi:MAG: bifunctional nuclease family protein [Actinomycetota bacterium]|nr:bifunctional nuclease family protein [Actinomycetota bacterium]